MNIPFPPFPHAPSKSRETLRATFAGFLLLVAAGNPAVLAQQSPSSVDAAAIVTPQTDPPETKANRRSFGKSDHDNLMDVMGLGLGCVATVMGIGVAFLAIWTEYRKRSELLAACHRERLAALEKGLELPPYPEEFNGSDMASAPRTPRTGLKPGLVLVATGLGLWMFLSPGNRGILHPTVGAIPGAIGVAYLVYYLIEGRKRGPATGNNVPGQAGSM